jgi:hypothetical protein
MDAKAAVAALTGEEPIDDLTVHRAVNRRGFTDQITPGLEANSGLIKGEQPRDSGVVAGRG